MEFIRVLKNVCSVINDNHVFHESFSMFFMFDHRKKVANILLTFAICIIFSMFFSCHFDPEDKLMVKVISFSTRRSF